MSPLASLVIEGVGAEATVRLAGADGATIAGPAPLQLRFTDEELAELQWFLRDYPTERELARLKGDSPWEVDRRAVLGGRLLPGYARRLGEALVPEPLQAKLEAHLQACQASGGELGLVVTAPELGLIPWELAKLPSGQVVGRSKSAVLVRRLAPTAPPAPAVPSVGHVRVLYVVARPEEAGFLPLDGVAQAMFDALRKVEEHRLLIDVLRPPTPERLAEALQEGGYHVLHIDAHGTEGRGAGRGVVLEDDGGKAARLDAEDLASLCDGGGLRLVVLNACRSAEKGDGGRAASLAEELARAGVPAVVAMQQVVRVRTASDFAGAFYKGLARGQEVGRAVALAREVLAVGGRLKLLTDWHIPVVYRAGGLVAFPPGDGVEAPPEIPGKPLEPTDVFQGRERELWRVDRALINNRRVVLVGLGGFGKTQLALRAAQWLRDCRAFPDGTSFVSFEEGQDALWLLNELGQRFDVPEWNRVDPDTWQDRLVEHLAKRRMLLVFDNMETVVGDPAPGDDVERHEERRSGLRDFLKVLREGCPRLRVLATSREAPVGHAEQHEHTLEIWALDPPSAMQLVRALTAAIRSGRAELTEDEQVAATALIDKLECHPLAIELALARALTSYGEGLASVVEQLDGDLETVLHDPARDDLPERLLSIRASFEGTWRTLRPEPAEILVMLAVFPGAFLDPYVTMAFELDEARWQAARSELLRRRLLRGVLDAEGTPRLEMHAVIRACALKRLPDRRRQEERVATLYRKHALRMAAGTWGPQGQAAAAWLRSEGAALEHWARWYESEGRWEEVCQLLMVQSHYSWASGKLAQAMTLAEAVASAGRRWERVAAEDKARREAIEYQGIAANDAANSALRMGNLDKAQRLYEQSIELKESIGEAVRAASSRYQLAMVLGRRGELREAVAAFRSVRAEFIRLDAEQEVPDCDHQLGVLEQRLGNLPAALGHMVAAVRGRVASAQRSLPGLADSLGQLGILLEQWGCLEAALGWQRLELAIRSAIHDPVGRARSLIRVGGTLLLRGDAAAAVPVLRDAAVALIQLERNSAVPIAWLVEARRRLGHRAFERVGGPELTRQVVEAEPMIRRMFPDELPLTPYYLQKNPPQPVPPPPENPPTPESLGVDKWVEEQLGQSQQPGPTATPQAMLQAARDAWKQSPDPEQRAAALMLLYRALPPPEDLAPIVLLKKLGALPPEALQQFEQKLATLPADLRHRLETAPEAMLDAAVDRLLTSDST